MDATGPPVGQDRRRHQVRQLPLVRWAPAHAPRRPGGDPAPPRLLSRTDRRSARVRLGVLSSVAVSLLPLVSGRRAPLCPPGRRVANRSRSSWERQEAEIRPGEDGVARPARDSLMAEMVQRLERAATLLGRKAPAGAPRTRVFPLLLAAAATFSPISMSPRSRGSWYQARIEGVAQPPSPYCPVDDPAPRRRGGEPPEHLASSEHRHRRAGGRGVHADRRLRGDRTAIAPGELPRQRRRSRPAASGGARPIDRGSRSRTSRARR